jgi:hypothetical protein
MMRVFIILVTTIFVADLFLTQRSCAQVPEKISYQAVLRNNNNQLLTSQAVGLRISILRGSTIFKIIYVETHYATTNENGLITVEIGGGTVVSGDFSAINWADGPYYIKTSIDPEGGTDYTIISTSQLLSVPYAMYARTSENIAGIINETDPVFSAWDKNYNDLANKPNIKDTVYAYADGSETKISAGTNSTITGSGTTTSPYIVNYSGFSHYIGDIFGGGIVVAVWKEYDVEKGLIASLTDMSTGAVWSNLTAQIGTYAQSLYNGQSNTNAIIAQSGHTESAAKLCDDFTNAEMGTGIYSDWYLPASWELNLCYHAAFIVNTILSGSTGFQSALYWSSTESGISAEARSQDFYDGSTYDKRKYLNYRVRAVRRF